MEPESQAMLLNPVLSLLLDMTQLWLQDMPDKYIFEPWKAPEAVQKKANCIVGKDYPHPLVDHATKHKARCMCHVLSCEYRSGLLCCQPRMPELLQAGVLLLATHPTHACDPKRFPLVDHATKHKASCNSLC